MKTQAIAIKGKLHTYERVLFRGLAESMYQGEIKVTLLPQKSVGGATGSVIYGDLEKGKCDLRFKRHDGNVVLSMAYIAHEMTHLKQYLSGALKICDGSIYWKGDRHMSVSEYQAVTDYYDYKTLPWEAEAYEAQDTLPRQYLLENGPALKGVDSTLDYLIDNDLLY
jgi:hypothetical protein